MLLAEAPGRVVFAVAQRGEEALEGRRLLLDLAHGVCA